MLYNTPSDTHFLISTVRFFEPNRKHYQNGVHFGTWCTFPSAPFSRGARTEVEPQRQYLHQPRKKKRLR